MNCASKNLEINKDLILLDVKIESREKLLNKMADNLKRLQFVRNTFIDALNKRELEFPTALQTHGFGVAIPHTDPEHVKQQAISIAVLNKPVEFTHMGTKNQKVLVNIVFMLAIKQADSQLDLLQKLMELFQKEEVLKKIKFCKSKSKIVDLIKKELF